MKFKEVITKKVKVFAFVVLLLLFIPTHKFKDFPQGMKSIYPPSFENNWNIKRRIAPFLSPKVYVLKSKRSKVKRIKTLNVLGGDEIDCIIALKSHLDDI